MGAIMWWPIWRGQGSYVGTVMTVTLAQDGWWGEGDDFLY